MKICNKRDEDTGRGMLFEIIPDIHNIEQSMELSLEYGVAFEYNDFMMPHVLDREEECERRICFYKNLERDRTEDTLHGAFLDIVIHSTDSLIREASETRVYQSMRIAEALGVRGVVFHTGLIAHFHASYYEERWLDKNVRFWTKVLKDFPDQEIYIENMFEENGRLCKALGEAMKEEPRFGLCLDYAHASAFGDPGEIDRWFRQVAPYVRHMHINDNDLQDDLHLAVGDGRIGWKQFEELLSESRIQASVLIEVKGYEAQKKSLEYLRRLGILKL